VRDDYFREVLMIKAPGIVIIIVLTLPFSNNIDTIGAQDLSYESDIEYIVTQYFLGNYEEAVRLLHKHYFDYQQELAYLYGLCYLKLNMNRIALDYFNKTLAEHENNYEVLNNIGVAYFKDDDYVNAMKYFHLSFIANTDYELAKENYNAAYESWTLQREGETIRPVIPFTEKPTMYNSLGWFYYYSGDYHNAIYYFKKAIDEDKNYQFAYISLAYLYDEENNFEAALHYLKKAKNLDENNPDLYNNLGIVYYHLAAYKNAETAFKRAIQLNYRFAEPHNNLGFLYFERDEYRAAEDYFTKSVELNLDNQALRAESVAGLALINMKREKPDRATAYKAYSLALDYRMNDITYLTTHLKWSAELIELWAAL
jgi:tetratricopeptide (TPR) repeat protein